MHARVCAVKSLSSHNHTRETSRLTRESAAASEGTRVSRRALALSSHCLLAPPDGLSSLPLFSAALRPLSLAPLKLIARQSASSLFPRGVREAARGRQQDCCSRSRPQENQLPVSIIGAGREDDSVSRSPHLLLPTTSSSSCIRSFLLSTRFPFDLKWLTHTHKYLRSS